MIDMKKRILALLLTAVMVLGGSSLVAAEPGQESATESEVIYENDAEEPLVTAEPTETPEPTAEPTETPEPTAEPTEAPEPTAEPTEAPEPTSNTGAYGDCNANSAAGRRDSFRQLSVLRAGTGLAGVCDGRGHPPALRGRSFFWKL